MKSLQSRVILLNNSKRERDLFFREEGDFVMIFGV